MDRRRLQREFFRRIASPMPLGELFDQLPEVYFFAKDMEGRFTMVNRALLSKHGFTRELDMIGLTDFDIHEAAVARHYVEEDRQVMRTRRAVLNRVWLVPGQDAALKWYVSSKVPLTDAQGRVIGLAGAMRDVEKVGALLAPCHELTPVIAHLSDHYDQPIRVADLADLAGLSVSQFERRFRQMLGTTPGAYITQVRLDAACRLLTRTQHTIAEIAMRCGFYDQSHFTKHFRRRMSVTPTEYRRRHAAGES